MCSHNANKAKPCAEPCEALPPPVERAKVEVQPCAKLAFSARIKREALELNRRFAQPPPLYCGTVAQWLLQYFVLRTESQAAQNIGLRRFVLNRGNRVVNQSSRHITTLGTDPQVNSGPRRYRAIALQRPKKPISWSHVPLTPRSQRRCCSSDYLAKGLTCCHIALNRLSLLQMCDLVPLLTVISHS
jgi:hypothetical protein